MCNLLPSLAPVWRIFLATLQGKQLFLDSGRPEGVKMTIFKTGGCASYIVNNEWIACGAVLRTVPVQGALGRVLDLDFSSLLEPLGSHWSTFAHLWRTSGHLLTPLLHSLLHRCIFMHFGVPRGTQNPRRRLGRGTSGGEVILHLAPLGEALAWVLATFAIYEASEAL